MKLTKRNKSVVVNSKIFGVYILTLTSLFDLPNLFKIFQIQNIILCWMNHQKSPILEFQDFKLDILVFLHKKKEWKWIVHLLSSTR